MSVRINSLIFQTVLFCIISSFIGIITVLITLQVYAYYVIILILVMGTLAGVALGYFSEKRILKSIEQKGEYDSRVSFSLALVLFILMLWLFAFFYRGLYFPTEIAVLLLLFFIPAAPVSFATQSRIVWQWQKKNQKKIIDGRKAIYAVLPSQWPPKIEGSG